MQDTTKQNRKLKPSHIELFTVSPWYVNTFEVMFYKSVNNPCKAVLYIVSFEVYKALLSLNKALTMPEL